MVGGIIAGVVFCVILGFMIYKFCTAKKREIVKPEIKDSADKKNI